MKVCIVAEGCYPYVVGGVSGWINSMIKSFPNIEFILLTIVANRSVRGKFVYELPENLTQVYELYLEDWDPEAEWVRLDYGPGSPIFTFTVDLKERESEKYESVSISRRRNAPN